MMLLMRKLMSLLVCLYSVACNKEIAVGEGLTGPGTQGFCPWPLENLIKHCGYHHPCPREDVDISATFSIQA